MASEKGLPFPSAMAAGSAGAPVYREPPKATGGGATSTAYKAPPQNTSHADDAATHDKGAGSDFPQADVPAVRKQFIGTVAGSSQRKPFNVK